MILVSHKPYRTTAPLSSRLSHFLGQLPKSIGFVAPTLKLGETADRECSFRSQVQKKNKHTPRQQASSKPGIQWSYSHIFSCSQPVTWRENPSSKVSEFRISKPFRASQKLQFLNTTMAIPQEFRASSSSASEKRLRVRAPCHVNSMGAIRMFLDLLPKSNIWIREATFHHVSYFPLCYHQACDILCLVAWFKGLIWIQPPKNQHAQIFRVNRLLCSSVVQVTSLFVRGKHFGSCPYDT